jgi:hypothetical protein
MRWIIIPKFDSEIILGVLLAFFVVCIILSIIKCCLEHRLRIERERAIREALEQLASEEHALEEEAEEK